VKKSRCFLLPIFVAVIFILLELASRWCINYVSNPWPRFPESACWRYYWLSHNKERIKSGDRDLSNEVYIYADYDKNKGWNLRPNLRNVKGLSGEQINSNSNGFRGTKEFTLQKIPERKRIAIIGDSYVFGEVNNDNQIFPYYLGEMLPSAEILNLGVRGYGHDQMLLKLKEEGIKYNPDIVILLFLGLDISRNLETFRDYAKSKYILQNGSLVMTGVPVPTPREIVKADRYHIYLIDCAKILLYEIKNSIGLQEKEENKITAAILKEMKTTCDKSGAKFIIVAFDQDKWFFQGVSEGGGISCLFFNPDEKHKDRPVDAFSGHWTPEGHKIVAQCIYELLLNNNLLQN